MKNTVLLFVLAVVFLRMVPLTIMLSIHDFFFCPEKLDRDLNEANSGKDA